VGPLRRGRRPQSAAQRPQALVCAADAQPPLARPHRPAGAQRRARGVAAAALVAALVGRPGTGQPPPSGLVRETERSPRQQGEAPRMPALPGKGSSSIRRNPPSLL